MTPKGLSCLAWRWMVREPDPSVRRLSRALGGGGPGSSSGGNRDLYAQLGHWHPTAELAETLQFALRGDSNQLAAASSLARVFGGSPEVGCKLIALTRESVNPWVTAAALDALSRGWPSIDGLDNWVARG